MESLEINFFSVCNYYAPLIKTKTSFNKLQIYKKQTDV